MTRNEKIALFNLAVLAVSVGLYIGLFAVVTAWKPEIGLVQRWIFSSSAFAICGLMGLSGLFFRKGERDERDALIELRATFGAHMLFWLYFVAFAMITWGVHMHRGLDTVSIHVLPLFVGSGLIMVFTARSVIMLVLYRIALDAGAEA